jgi:hypothetical protein
VDFKFPAKLWFPLSIWAWKCLGFFERATVLCFTSIASSPVLFAIALVVDRRISFPLHYILQPAKNKAMTPSKHPTHTLLTPKEQLVTGVTLGYVRPTKREFI